jgi:iron complex outermembrane receptor protein
LQWTTGLFYFNDKTAFEKNSSSYFGAPFAFTGGSGVKDTSIAAFGDITYQLLDNLYLTAGLRYSKDKITDAYFDDPLTLQKVNVSNIDDDETTPRIALRYEINNKSSVYASYSEGFKSGILNVGGATLDGIEVKPEKIKAYEIGYKLSSGSLMMDVATYYYDYTNLQVASYVGPTSVIQNAANSTVYGVDGQLRYAITQQFEINIGAAYLHAEYDDFEKSQVWSQCLNPAGCGATSPYGSFVPDYANAAGNEMQYAPKFTGTLGINYRTEIAQGALNLSSTLYHTSDFYFDSSEAYKQDAYNLLSARAEWTDPSGHYTVAVYGDNLTDEEYRTQVLPQQLGTLSTWGMPRTVGVSLEAHY